MVAGGAEIGVAGAVGVGEPRAYLGAVAIAELLEPDGDAGVGCG